MNQRASGILLHLASLSNPYPIGDLKHPSHGLQVHLRETRCVRIAERRSPT
jgi:hypothetical protein